MKGYPARLSTNGKDRLWRSINRDATRSLSQLKEKKDIKKKEITDVMSAVEESKALVQRVASESDCSKGIFDTSEGSNNNDEGSCNNNDEGSCTESDSSLEDNNNYDEDSCSKSDDKKTELLEPSSCMFKCNFPKCRYNGDFSGKMESLVPCVRCLSPFHFSCQHVQDFFLMV